MLAADDAPSKVYSWRKPPTERAFGRLPGGARWWSVCSARALCSAPTDDAAEVLSAAPALAAFREGRELR